MYVLLYVSRLAGFVSEMRWKYKNWISKLMSVRLSVCLSDSANSGERRKEKPYIVRRVFVGFLRDFSCTG